MLYRLFSCSCLYQLMCSQRSLLIFLTVSTSIFYFLSLPFASSNFVYSYLSLLISDLSLFGSYSSLILVFLAANLVIFYKKEWLNRLPETANSIKAQFLDIYSNTKGSTYSEKQLFSNFTTQICLSTLNISIKLTKSVSLSLQLEKSNFLIYVCAKTVVNILNAPSSKKFLAQLSDTIFVYGKTSHKKWKPYGPISFNETSNSLS